MCLFIIEKAFQPSQHFLSWASAYYADCLSPYAPIPKDNSAVTHDLSIADQADVVLQMRDGEVTYNA